MWVLVDGPKNEVQLSADLLVIEVATRTNNKKSSWFRRGTIRESNVYFCIYLNVCNILEVYLTWLSQSKCKVLGNT